VSSRELQCGIEPKAETRGPITAHSGDMMAGSLGTRAIWRFERVVQVVNSEETCQQAVET
jgi:hypothetical protein